MKFRLRYSGTLDPKWLKNKAAKQGVRRQFAPQIMDVWKRLIEANGGAEKWNPLRENPKAGDVNVVASIGGHMFAPLVSATYGWHTVAELDILFLRAAEPGQIIGHGGDIDNRIKVLFDCLRMPQNKAELPDDDVDSTGLFGVLLQDDALVTSYRVTTDRLLAPKDFAHVELIIGVTVRATRKTFFNASVW